MFSREQFTNWCKTLVSPWGRFGSSGADAENLSMRWPIRSDVPWLVALDELVTARPWSEEQFCEALRMRDSMGKVAELPDSGQVVGFIAYKFFPEHYEITKFMIHPEYRQSGVAKALLDSLKGKLETIRSCRRTHIDAIIDEYDLPTQQLFQANGFRGVGVVKGHFESLYETSDGFRLRYRPEETP